MTEFIKKYLEELPALDPLPTGVDPVLKRITGIKAFIFDIYGTLLISSSGDIERAKLMPRHLEAAMKASGIKVIFSRENDKTNLYEVLLTNYLVLAKNHIKNMKRSGIQYPEINVGEIWEQVLRDAKEKGWVESCTKTQIDLMTVLYEISVDHIYPMPGMNKVIDSLAGDGRALGIISNAQFYTPVIMNFFLGNKDLKSEAIKPFDADLTVFSFRLSRAKPDISLYTGIIPCLENKYGLQPREVLFTGNDMLNDIYPARMAGFKTALFAGDRRSLRFRKGRSEINGLMPDVVITKLEQLIEITS